MYIFSLVVTLEVVVDQIKSGHNVFYLIPGQDMPTHISVQLNIVLNCKPWWKNGQ